MSSPAEALLCWFTENRRDLPWRREPRDPYAVVVSEVMLQQTQVDRVVPRFVQFLAEFPDFHRLAAADEEAVLSVWSGLGYYRRARQLHRLARAVVELGGDLPRDRAALQNLPGIGPYTAAAVASIAFGAAEPVVDGNVLRVVARALAIPGDLHTAENGRIVSSWVASLMDGRPPGQVNEAMMELGATVCVPVAPACCQCPLAGTCKAKAEGRPERYPAPRRTRPAEKHRWVVACCVRSDGRWLLHRVVDGPILRGLWLPPFADLAEDSDPVISARRLLPLRVRFPRALPVVRHGITHRRITAVPVRFEPVLGETPDGSWRWADPVDPRMPTSSLLGKLVASETE